MSTSAFRPVEVGTAVGLAVAIEIGIGVLLAVAGSGSSLQAIDDVPPSVVPIEVTPVIEDVPLLKYGSKRNENQLPDMWRKPKPKPRYEDKSAPAVNADKNPTTLPTNEVAKSNERPAPTDAELAKKVDEIQPEEPLEKTPDPNLPEEGDTDGVVGGTEKDPLKAFIIDQYKAKLIAWFKQGFSPLEGSDFCGITVLISAHAGADRVVQSFSIAQSSGNAAFDERVRKHLQSKVGQQLPPPPPKYPELAESTINPRFSGENAACKGGSKKAPAKDSPDETPNEPSPDSPAPELRAPEPKPEPAPDLAPKAEPSPDEP
jgi:hypothetical protein